MHAQEHIDMILALSSFYSMYMSNTYGFVLQTASHMPCTSTTMDMSSSNQALGFMSLPPELRLMVYKYLFDNPTEPDPHHPLMKVSKQIRIECAPLIFRNLYLDITGTHDQDYKSWDVAYRVSTVRRAFRTAIISSPEWHSFRTSSLSGFVRHVGSLTLTCRGHASITVVFYFRRNEPHPVVISQVWTEDRHGNDSVTFEDAVRRVLEEKRPLWKKQLSGDYSLADLELVIWDLKKVENMVDHRKHSWTRWPQKVADASFKTIR